ncbi:MAG TPA: L,D-transpeptidase, partial [Anaerolineae bacterium]|nr:L,D-transpeptidase [Anaerolineae bacterium]
MRTWLALLFALLLAAACSSTPTATLPTPPAPSATPEPHDTPTGIAANERWIEVDLAAQKVRLHDGDRLLAEYPAAAGVGTSPETTTYPGVFEVRIMTRGPIENVPGVFVSDIVEFDLEHHNGLHSLPMDAEGQILDRTLGRPATAGCVRLAESAAVFAFA